MVRSTIWKQALALSALIVTPLLTGSAGLTSDLDRRVLEAHNRERATAGVAPLEWSPALAASARRWADHLGETGGFYHSNDEAGAPPEGENLWAGTRGYYTPEAMVGLWVAEKRSFQPGVFPSNSRTGDVEAVGHYTQLMWRKSSAVGCALGHSRDEDVLVCRYATAGNVIGQRPF